MKKISVALCVAVAVAGMIFPVSSHAAIFCNMDNAVGGSAPKAKALAVAATVSFLQGAARTFDMYSQVELLLAKSSGSFDAASDLASVGMQKLRDASMKFSKAAKTGEPGLSIVNKRLVEFQAQDYSRILAQQKVAPDSAAAKSLIPPPFAPPSYRQTAQGLLSACQQSINDLLSERSSTGKVYREVQRKTLPSNADLWGAMALWTETLTRGRLVSAIFAHAAVR